MQVFNFCRSKCHKNFKMKRNPRKVRWTKAYRKLAGKELAEDTTFELERRRNRPEKYDREVVQKTLKAIGKIEAIKSKRQERFYEGRMQKAKLKEKKASLDEAKRSGDSTLWERNELIVRCRERESEIGAQGRR